MSYRKRELTLLASVEQVIEACKRFAPAMGLRLEHESSQQLYFVEPFLSSMGRWLVRFRRRWWWYSRLETTVRLEPEGVATHAIIECERLGPLQSRRVEHDLVVFVQGVLSGLGQSGGEHAMLT